MAAGRVQIAPETVRAVELIKAKISENGASDDAKNAYYQALALILVGAVDGASEG
jgi:hypothetical protein